MCQLGGRDHNATSYSTETLIPATVNALAILAEIITLRAIALKPGNGIVDGAQALQRS